MYSPCLIADLLFGNCQRVSLLNPPDTFVWDNLSSSQLFALEREVVRLLDKGYSWRDLYTQCVLGNVLLAYRTGQDFDPYFCDSGGESSSSANEQLMAEALDLLQVSQNSRIQVMSFDLVFSSTHTSLLCQEYFKDDDGELQPSYNDVSSEEILPLHLDNDFYSKEEKKDELVNVHKYQKNKKRFWPQVR